MNKPISPGKFRRVKEDPRSEMVGYIMKVTNSNTIVQTLKQGDIERVNHIYFPQHLIQLYTGYRLGNYVYRKEIIYRMVSGKYLPYVQHVRVSADTYYPLDELLDSVYDDEPIRMLPYEDK